MASFVLMGVSGCGKTSVGLALAAHYGVGFIDGDTLHPQANIEKMARGEPLTDADRVGWLGDVGQKLAQSKKPLVIGCSALKRSYRAQIRLVAGREVHFLHLAATQEVLAKRVSNRPGHFMPATLLDSQFEALEPLQADELGREIDIAQSLTDVIVDCAAYLQEIGYE